MGKGDIKTKKGKLFAGSYGIKRPRKKVKKSSSPDMKNSARGTDFSGNSVARKESKASPTTSPAEESSEAEQDKGRAKTIQSTSEKSAQKSGGKTQAREKASKKNDKS